MGYRRRNNLLQFAEDPFSKNAQGIAKISHEVSLLRKVLQIEHQVKNMNNIYYDLCYTVIKNRDDKEVVDDDDNTNDYLYDDVSISNYSTSDYKIL